MSFENAEVVERHLKLLSRDVEGGETSENLTSSPLLTPDLLRYSQDTTASSIPFAQYGLIGSIVNEVQEGEALPERDLPESRLFYNTTNPSSAFICGSQGSGKSHTLSCLLENCLTESDASVLPKPLTGLLFHYDTFISDNGGSPCEAAFLASHPGIKVRVLCSPTNVATIKAS